MILRKIKALLGMGSTDETGRSERDVVVQEESADAETEAAVKGVEEESAEGAAAEAAEESAEEEPADVESAGADLGSGEVDEPVAAATDADASTESLVDEAETQEHPESRAEPAEAAGPGAADESTDVAEVDVGAEEADAEAVEGVDVDEIKGIGPAYSDRLDEVGIHNVAQLAEADAEELAERITVSEKTVSKWIDRAQSFDE